MAFEKEHLESLLPKYPDPLIHRCFGLTMKGDNLVSSDNQTLKSLKASSSQQLDIYALTERAESPEAWRADLGKQIKKIDAIKINKAWTAHENWWKGFWNRSWIDVTATPDAEKVTQGYAMQRFITACAGRGAQPIKFNETLFTVGHDLPPGTVPTSANHDPDYRAWGACFWNQDTRLIYYPLIASGDYDLLKPWFDMYLEALPLEKARTWTYYHQDGTQAAVLGLTDKAQKVVVREFTAYGRHQFRWFWDPECGGSGMITLQLMLMQCDAKRIRLLPAWPADWTADFKLHAPYQTTVEGHVEGGKIVKLKVTPASRAKDVVVGPAGSS
jgi:hypothetical protein